MAIFSKPPAKKAEPSKPEPKVRPVRPGARPISARDLVSGVGAARGEGKGVGGYTPPEGTTTTNANVIDLAKPKPAIEIEQSSKGLCPVLENAALMFASDQLRPARQLLEDAVTQDEETKGSAFAWLCLFDLLHRAGDKAAFDRVALQYLVQFERSAPGWEELGDGAIGTRAANTGGTLALSGKLTSAIGAQLQPLKRIAHTDNTQLKLDLAGVKDFDDEGARLVAEALAQVRRRRAPLSVLHGEKLRDALETAVNEGREAGEGAWLLLLELLQWMGQQAAFDDRAVEYAVTFEMSPPSWEPLPPHRPVPSPRKTKSRASSTDAEVLAWSEAVTGATPREVKELAEFAETRSNVVLDMNTLDRMDFASAGALANAIHRIEAQRKTVQIAGASPILRALLLLVGIRPEIFVRKHA